MCFPVTWGPVRGQPEACPEVESVFFPEQAWWTVGHPLSWLQFPHRPLSPPCPRSPSAPDSGCPGARLGGPGQLDNGPFGGWARASAWAAGCGQGHHRRPLVAGPGLPPEIGPAGHHAPEGPALGQAWERGYLQSCGEETYIRKAGLFWGLWEAGRKTGPTFGPSRSVRKQGAQTPQAPPAGFKSWLCPCWLCALHAVCCVISLSEPRSAHLYDGDNW